MSLLNYEYELSIWRDIPVEKTFNIPAHFQEEKVAVLAANDLHNDISAFNPILKKNINGEKTLTFSLPRNYKKNGELLLNPYLSFLTNERKIKLRVGKEYSWSSPEDLEAEDSEEKWMTFVIKDVEEDKKSFTNIYTAKEIYVNELGKNGWTTTLDIELENNYGTLTDLAEKILEGSDWEVDNTSYSPVEVMIEPLFQTTVSTAFTAINVVTGTNFTIPKNAVIYPAYNSVRWDNDSSQWVFITGEKQFLFKGTGLTFNREDLNDDFIVVDEDYNYNYTVINPITTGGINLTGATIGEIPLQAQIIIKNIDTHYDTTLEKYVKKYQVENAAEVGLAKGTSVFGYEETQYLVSEVVQNYLTNNTNFINTLGWLPVNTLLPNTLPQTAAVWDDASAPTNYLTIPLGGSAQKYYNEGPRNLRLELVKDKVYVVRLKARVITDNKKDYGTNGANILTTLASFPTVSARFVTYNYINQTPGEVASVSRAGNLKPAAASGINSTTTINNRGYANSATGARTRFNKSNFSGGVYPSLHDQDGYYYTYLQATETTESSSLDKVVFRLTVSGGAAGTSLYIEDIQVFDYVEDETSQHLPIFLNDTPEGSVKFVPKFYYINNQKKIVNLPSDTSYYKPEYRAGYTAVRHIDVRESNYFNNLTSLAELFEVWIKFEIKHKKNGEILLVNGKPIKRVIFSKYTPYGDTFNYAGFKYGINLDSIKRSITSTGIATKVIVKNNNQQYAVDGMASIARAVNNPSKDNTIFNFDYYVNQGLLDHATLLRDLYGLSSQDFALLPNLKRINEKYQIEANLLQKYKSELEVAKKYIEMYESAIEGAKESYNQEKYLYDNTDPKDTQNRDRYKLVMNQLHAQANAFRAARDTYVSRQSNYEAKITSTQTVLDNLSIEKNTLNTNFYQKYSQYILEGTWTDEKYIDDDLYYLDALKVSATNAFPKISYDIKVIDLEGLEEYQNYHFEVGQRTYIEDTEFFGWVGKDINGTEVKTPYQMEVIVSEYVRYFDDPSKTTVTIKNYKNQYEDLFQRMVATTNQLQYQSGYYAKSANQFDNTGTIKVDSLEQAFAKNAFILANSMNESVKWDSKSGIEVTDLLNTNLVLRLVSRGLFLTSDGGQTWDEAITGQGINTKYLRAGEIDADKINIIMNGRRIFRWDNNGISAFTTGSNVDYDIDKYVRFNQYGLYGTTQGSILENALTQVDTYQDKLETIQNYSNFSLTWDGLAFKSPVGDIHLGRFLSEAGNSYDYGFRMRNVSGDIVLQTDLEGNLWIAGNLTSSNYISNVSGWKILRDGSAEFENVIVRGTLKSTVFSYDEINAQGGSLIISKSGILEEELLLSSQPTITFSLRDKHLSIFDINDTIKILTHITPEEKALIWLKVLAKNNGVYTAEILSKNPNSELIIPAGTPLINYGQKDTGYVLLRADDVMSGPYIDVIVNEEDNIYLSSAQKLKVRLGDLSAVNDPLFGLNGLSGYGLYAENAYLTGTVALPSAGITNYTAIDEYGDPITGRDEVRLWAGGSYSDILTDTLENIPFRVHESGKIVMRKSGTTSPAFIFDPVNNKVEFGGNTKITIGNIADDVIPDNYQVIVTGKDILKGESYTTLSVKLLRNGVDITLGVKPENFVWLADGDKNNPLGIGKSVVIHKDDVNGSVEITCIYIHD